MSDFNAKMYQIRFPPHIQLGELTALPQTSYLDLRGLLLRGEGREGERGERRGREGGGWKLLAPPPNADFWLRH